MGHLRRGRYVHLLRRLRNQVEDIVHAPDFNRDVDESIGSALPIRRDVPLVVTEGNYLLSDRGLGRCRAAVGRKLVPGRRRRHPP